ncbi:MAG: TRAP transporter substrate-binding protein [Bacillota bacterium]
MGSKRKWMSLLILVILVIVSIALGGCGAKKEEPKPATKEEVKPITLRLAHYAAESHPLGQAAKFFGKNAEEKSQGRLKVEIFPANSLGAPQEIAEQVRIGTLDMSLNTGGQLSQYVPQYMAIQLPFIWTGPQHVYRVLDGEGGQLLADLAAKQNFLVLSNWDWGFRHFTNSKRPINTPDDLKGLKMRVPPEKAMEASLRALGAIPTTVSYSELYMALSQGVVDGQENPLLAIYTDKFFEPNKHVALVGYMYNNAIHLISKNAWDKMPDDLRKIVKQASEEARDYMRKQMNDKDADITKELEAKGVQFTRPDPAPFKKAVEPAVAELVKSIGDDFYQKWIVAVEKAK